MVTDLQLKPAKHGPLASVSQLQFDATGIHGSIASQPLRQVLLVSTATLREFNLAPGDLRENIVVELDNLQALESGTVLKLGEAIIRLTFHCEPCKVIQPKVDLKRIVHKRGVFGQFLNTGTLHPGDLLTIQPQTFDPIPYIVRDRVQWYLNKQTQPVPVTQLLNDIGVSLSYARAVPGYLARLPERYRGLVVFGRGTAKTAER